MTEPNTSECLCVGSGFGRSSDPIRVVTMKERLNYQQQQMTACLLSQAALCEHIAAACADEAEAVKFKEMARDCREAAGDPQPGFARE